MAMAQNFGRKSNSLWYIIPDKNRDRDPNHPIGPISFQANAKDDV
jgi:hypothetical protein